VNATLDSWISGGSRRAISGSSHELFVRQDGPVDGKPVTLFHGFPASSFDWAGVVPDLTGFGYRVTTLDFLGYGSSDKPHPYSYSLMEQASLVQAVCTARVFLAQDTFTQAMTSAYRQQLNAQILEQEEERSALVEALLSRRITDTQSLWEAADLLRLPTSGPYVVVAAELPAIGKLGLPAIESKLSTRDIRSAWRLLPDLQVGIVHLRSSATPDALGTLIEVLRQTATTRVGISPPFHDLSETSGALRFARLAVIGKPSADSLVVVFDDTPLAVAAVSAPEVMAKTKSSVLGRLNELAAEERTILLDTFQAWLQAGGSANDTAAKIFCHPNTVRHRLRRIEELTGRSLSRPKDIAELCLAFEVEQRLP
jgi:PucR C-terminal helix-turn-helix domain/GGDEF-like domain/alpha/beta hydrolase fold